MDTELVELRCRGMTRLIRNPSDGKIKGQRPIAASLAWESLHKLLFRYFLKVGSYDAVGGQVFVKIPWNIKPRNLLEIMMSAIKEHTLERQIHADGDDLSKTVWLRRPFEKVESTRMVEFSTIERPAHAFEDVTSQKENCSLEVRLEYKGSAIEPTASSRAIWAAPGTIHSFVKYKLHHPHTRHAEGGGGVYWKPSFTLDELHEAIKLGVKNHYKLSRVAVPEMNWGEALVCSMRGSWEDSPECSPTVSIQDENHANTWSSFISRHKLGRRDYFVVEVKFKD